MRHMEASGFLNLFKIIKKLSYEFKIRSINFKINKLSTKRIKLQQRENCENPI